MVKKLDLVQNSPEWYEFRKTKIGASEIPTILGQNPYKTPYELFLERTGKKEGFKGNYASERGKLLEPIARDLFNRTYKTAFIPVCFERDFMLASLDGYDHENEIDLEIKCPSEKYHLMAQNNQIPDIYYAQVQYQIYISGCFKAIYCSFDGKEIAIVKASLNQKFIDETLPTVERFYKCITTNFWDGLEANVDVKKHIVEYNIIEQKIKALEADKEKIRNYLQDNVKTKLQVEGYTLQWVTRKGTIDYKSIEVLKNVDLEQYRKRSSKIFEIRHSEKLED